MKEGSNPDILTFEEKTDIDFAIIASVDQHAERLGGRSVVVGGYAVDAQRGHISRFHKDVDLQIFLPTRNPSDIHQFLTTVFPSHEDSDTSWEFTSYGNDNQVFVSSPTGQRVDIYFCQLGNPSDVSSISRRRQHTNIFETIPVERVTFPDLRGRLQTLWVNPVSYMVATRIVGMKYYQTQDKRSFQESDSVDLTYLLHHLEFNDKACLVYLIALIERIKYKEDRETIVRLAMEHLNEVKEQLVFH